MKTLNKFTLESEKYTWANLTLDNKKMYQWHSGQRSIFDLKEIRNSFKTLLLVCLHIQLPAGKNLFKVSKITLEQRPFGLGSSVISLTLNKFLPGGYNQSQYDYIIFSKGLFTWMVNSNYEFRISFKETPFQDFHKSKDNQEEIHFSI